VRSLILPPLRFPYIVYRNFGRSIVRLAREFPGIVIATALVNKRIAGQGGAIMVIRILMVWLILGVSLFG